MLHKIRLLNDLEKKSLITELNNIQKLILTTILKLKKNLKTYIQKLVLFN